MLGASLTAVERGYRTEPPQYRISGCRWCAVMTLVLYLNCSAAKTSRYPHVAQIWRIVTMLQDLQSSSFFNLKRHSIGKPPSNHDSFQVIHLVSSLSIHTVFYAIHSEEARTTYLAAPRPSQLACLSSGKLLVVHRCETRFIPRPIIPGRKYRETTPPFSDHPLLRNRYRQTHIPNSPL